MVETFHSSTDPFLEQEASAQRSWHLGTAAMALPGQSLPQGDSAVASVTGQVRADLFVSVLL